MKINLSLKNDEYWMKKALNLAKKAKKKDEVPVGAVLVFNNKIIGEGFNSSILNNDPTAHAEILSLRKGGKLLKNYRLLNSVLYVTMEPCLMCLGAILNSRVSTLVYGVENKKNGIKEINYFSKILNFNKLKIIHGILKLECSFLLKKFFQKKRKK